MPRKDFGFGMFNHDLIPTHPETRTKELADQFHDFRLRNELLNKLARTHLVLLDDWGLAALDDEQRKDLLEILDDRHQQRATLVTSQLPINKWHQIIKTKH